MLIGFLLLRELIDTRVRVLVAKYSHAMLFEDMSYNEFHSIIEQYRKDSSKYLNTIPDKDFAYFAIQSKMAIVAFIAGDNEDLLAKLRRDKALCTPLTHRKLGTTRFDSTLVLALLDFIYPIKTAIYSTTEELFILISNFLLLSKLEKKDNEPRMNLIMLIILVISKEYIDKIVINPSSGMGERKRCFTCIGKEVY